MSYTYLTRALKRRLVDDLRAFFASLPGYEDLAEQVRIKHDWDTAPQRAVVIMGVTPTPIRLSSDNFMGVEHSYVMKANVDNGEGNPTGRLQTGLSLAWVKEDTRLVDERFSNRFPSPPGVYYVSVHAIPQEFTDDGRVARFEHRFYVDPLYQVRQEQVLEAVTGLETSATLSHAPFHGDSLRLFLSPDIPLIQGRGLRLENTGGIRVLEATTAKVGLRPGPVPVSVITDPGPWMVVAGFNDVLSGVANGLPFMVVLPPGPLTPLALRRAVKDGAALTGLFSPEFDVTVIPGDRVELRAETSLFLDEDAISTANGLLGLPEGWAPVVLEGDLFEEDVAPGATLLALRLAGVDYHYQLPEGPITREQILARLQAATPPAAATAWSLVERGDYSADPVTGLITIRIPLQPGDVLYADYRYPGVSGGPYPMKRYESNNTVIPGAVLAWSGLLPQHLTEKPDTIPADKFAVVVHESRQAVADVYGGKFTLSVDLEVISRDAQAREELADLLLLQFHHWEHDRLASDGLALVNVSGGGESEEVYDDNGDDYFFRTSIGLEFMADWMEYVPRPLYIERIVPLSYEAEAATVGPDGEVIREGEIAPAQGFDRLSPQDAFRKARESDYEGVR